MAHSTLIKTWKWNWCITINSWHRLEETLMDLRLRLPFLVPNIQIVNIFSKYQNSTKKRSKPIVIIPKLLLRNRQVPFTKLKFILSLQHTSHRFKEQLFLRIDLNLPTRLNVSKL